MTSPDEAPVTRPAQGYGPAWIGGVVHDDFMTDHLILRIGRHTPSGTEIVTSVDADGTTVRVLPEYKAQAYAVDEREDVLRIPEPIARTLLDALVQHFGGTSNSQQLRKDYDAERDRVDRLIGALVDRVTP